MGHGPHRYIFQLFALAARVDADPGETADRRRPRALLTSITTSILSRGRLTGAFER